MSGVQAKRVDQQRKPKSGNGLQQAVLAAVVTSLANLLVMVGAKALGVTFLMPGPAGELMPLAWPFVVTASALPALLAPAVYGLFRRLVMGNPLRTFRITAAVLLVLSFALPFVAGGAQADIATKLTLNLMHVVSAVGILLIVKE